MDARNFGIVKDDAEKLNEHTEAATRALDTLMSRFAKMGIDGRAVYAGLTIMHTYYYKLGSQKLGASYMSRLQDQSETLGEEMMRRLMGN